MRNYWKIVNRIIDESQIIIEVLDARFINDTRNIEIERKIKFKRKKIIYAINKSDLISVKFSDLDLGIEPFVFVCSTKNLGTTKLRNIIRDYVFKLRGRNEEKIVNIGVVGYPNTGKSSLINVLGQRKAASTSPIPGHTHGMQKIRLFKRVYLFDTPGVFPGSIKFNDTRNILSNVVDPNSVKDPDVYAWKIIETIASSNPKILEKVYGIKYSGNPESFIKDIAIKNNWLLKGGIPNIDDVSRRIIRNWQRGKLK